MIDIFKVIIAGSRYFDNYEYLKEKMDWVLQNIKDNIVVISGAAPGADTLGEKYAVEKGYDIISKPADWSKYGRSAGPIRNREMAKIADACVCFWDGKSKGTKNMITLAKEYGLKLKVFMY